MVKKNEGEKSTQPCVNSAYLKNAECADLRRKNENELLLTHDNWLKAVTYHQLLQFPRWIWESRLEDVVQEARLVLLRCSRRYVGDRGATLKTYAAIRIKGHIRDMFRRQKPPDISLQYEAEEGRDHAVQSDFVAELQLVNDMKVCRGRLDRWERNLLTLLFEEGELARSVADMCGCTESRISQLRSEVLGHMEKILVEEGYTDAHSTSDSRFQRTA